MPEDKRRVQTGVIGRADSLIPAFMPLDKADAVRYRKEHARDTFWCGVHLGGCGKQLTGKIYGDRVCHFAHHPPVVCTRADLGEGGADHLFINRDLTKWLQQQTRFSWTPKFHGSPKGRGYTSLEIKPKGSSANPTIFVQLRDDEPGRPDRSEKNARLRVQAFSMGSKYLFRNFLRREGFALRIKCVSDGHRRIVKIGRQTSVRENEIQWFDLRECRLLDGAILLPGFDEGRNGNNSAQTTSTWIPHAASRQTVRRKLAKLLLQVDQARKDGDIKTVETIIDQMAWIKSLRPEFEPFESRRIEEHKTWIDAATCSAPAAKKVERGISDQIRLMIRDILDQAREEIDASHLAEARKLLARARKLLPPAKNPGFATEREQINSCERLLGNALSSSEGEHLNAPAERSRAPQQVEDIAQEKPIPPEVRDPAQVQARLLMEKVLTDLNTARQRNDTDTWMRLFDEASTVVDRLAEVDKTWADQRLRKEEQRFRDFVKESEVASELDGVLIEAVAALKSSDLARARELHGRAFELFQGISIRDTRIFINRLNSLQKVLNELRRSPGQPSGVKPMVLPTGSTAKLNQPIGYAIREKKRRASQYVAMIESEMTLKRVGLVSKLCKGLETLLANAPATHFREEVRQLTEFKAWVRQNWPHRR
ncbi:hypothetical protein [Streptosporangium sp. NPDC049046]|uniref:hypothetical protein n=1 Tax=Streptosporangium sp. NPDC049046 TaxID=3155031 RepID=UPI003425377A